MDRQRLSKRLSRTAVLQTVLFCSIFVMVDLIKNKNSLYVAKLVGMLLFFLEYTAEKTGKQEET